MARFVQLAGHWSLTEARYPGLTLFVLGVVLGGILVGLAVEVGVWWWVG